MRVYTVCFDQNFFKRISEVDTYSKVILEAFLKCLWSPNGLSSQKTKQKTKNKKQKNDNNKDKNRKGLLLFEAINAFTLLKAKTNPRKEIWINFQNNNKIKSHFFSFIYKSQPNNFIYLFLIGWTHLKVNTDDKYFHSMYRRNYWTHYFALVLFKTWLI